MTDALAELAPQFATETGTCRSEDCTNPAPALLIGDRIPTFCDTCSDAEDSDAADRKTSKFVERSGIPRRLRAWTLERYATDEVSRAALADARRWLDDYLAGRTLPFDQALTGGGRRNLLLAGSIGSGKSSLAAAIAHKLCSDGIGVRWVVLRDLLEEKRESFDGGRPVDLDSIRRAPVLVLDDLGAERLSPWAAEQLEVIVSTRYDAGAPSICTSNLTPAQLAARIAASGMSHESDPEFIRAERIVSRLTEGAQRIQFTGNDRRLSRAHAPARVFPNPRSQAA